MSTIRRCEPGDFEDIASLLRQLWPDRSLQMNLLRGVFLELLSSPSQHYICATANSKVIAFCSLMVKNSLYWHGPLGILEEMVVDEQYRRQGVGTKLLQRIMEIAKEAGCQAVSLDSDLHRSEAHAFYEKHGFQRSAFFYLKEL